MRWGPDGMPDELRLWLDSPVTKLVVELVKELAMNPPTAYAGSVVENYGLTTGLQLASAVIEDPTILFPGLFEEAPQQTALPVADYNTRGV